MIALSPGEPDVVLGESTFNIAKYADRQRVKYSLPVRDGFFNLGFLVSVVDLHLATEIGIDAARVIAAEDPERQDKIGHEKLSAINAMNRKDYALRKSLHSQSEITKI